MSPMRPKITVLIPTFNRAKYLGECLESIFSQTLPAEQIIVVNDGSTDQTRRVCEPYMKAIEYLELGQLGKPTAINYGIARTSGDYLWIFDDDDVAFADALARFVEPLENHPEYGFSYSAYYLTATQEETGRIGSVIRKQGIPNIEKRGFLIPLMEWNFLGGAALFARTSCYKEVGKFDPTLLRSQDYEMAIRIARRFKGVRVPGSPTFHYRQHEGLRGATRDQFPASNRHQKWLEYDQIFFRRLHRELPLDDYLLPGNSLENNLRQAILQRLAIMAYKRLFLEVIKDLQELAKVTDVTAFSEEEYLMIRQMIMYSDQQVKGSIFDCFEFFDEIRRLSVSSKVIRMLRGKVVRALLARYKSNPSWGQIPGIVRRLFHLFF